MMDDFYSGIFLIVESPRESVAEHQYVDALTLEVF